MESDPTWRYDMIHSKANFEYMDVMTVVVN